MKNLLSVLGLAIALYLLYGNIIGVAKTPLKTAQQPESQADFDYVMEQLIIREYQADGSLSSTLVSPKLQQLTGQAYATLTTPELALAKGANEQWQLTAELAQFDQQQQLMHFIDNVRLFRPDATFEGSHLTVDLTTDIIKLSDGVQAQYDY
jgi:LPS export ABC transporter protein LptC